MIELITKKYDDTVAIRMSGTLTTGDYDVILPLLNEKIRKYEKINLYCELEDVESIKPGVFWKDLKFDVQHFNDFDRVALVGDKQWLDWMSKFTKPFTSAEIKYFDESEKKEALDWIAETTHYSHNLK